MASESKALDVPLQTSVEEVISAIPSIFSSKPQSKTKDTLHYKNENFKTSIRIAASENNDGGTRIRVYGDCKYEDGWLFFAWCAFLLLFPPVLIAYLIFRWMRETDNTENEKKCLESYLGPIEDRLLSHYWYF